MRRDALWPISLDENGNLSILSLTRLIERAERKKRPILLVVSVVGTTELGGIDPVHEVQDVLDRYRKKKGVQIWHHVDAAYGGFFRTLDLKSTTVFSEKLSRSLAAMSRADSITLDPHKLGYVPYASGAFLVRKKKDYFFAAFDDAPYLDFDKNTDRGPFTLEGSRSAAGAVGTWMSARTIGLNPSGYGLLLERTIRIRKDLSRQLAEAELPVQIAPGCDTNILCFACARKGELISVSNRRTMRLYDALSSKHRGAFIVSKTALRWKNYGAFLTSWTGSWSAIRDSDEIILIRMCMMNPFFKSIEMNVNYGMLFIQELRRHFRGSLSRVKKSRARD